MIAQLIRRDSAWKSAPYVTLAGAVASPFVASNLNRLAVLHLFLGFMSLLSHQAQVRATRFEAGLPITARDLFLGRYLALASSVWLPAAAGMAAIFLFAPGYRVMALLPVQVAAVGTLFLTILQSLRPSQIDSPKWIWAVLYVPFWTVAWVGVAAGVLNWVALVCALASAALFVRTWNALGLSFELAPAAASVSTPRPKAEETTLARNPLPWIAVCRSVFSWQHLFFLPQFLLAGFGGSAISTLFFLAMIWQLSRPRLLWLWNTPFQRSAVLPLFLAPPSALFAAGYFLRFHMGFHPKPVPELRVMILDLGFMVLLAVLTVFVNVLFDWRRLRSIPTKLRAAGLAIAIFIPPLAAIAAPRSWGTEHDALVRLAGELPTSPLVVFAGCCILLAALYVATVRIFHEAEFSLKPNPNAWGSGGWADAVR